ncbi:hypothetical protein SB773_30880, partial [Bacillus sp. SIMBA_074]
IDVALFDWADAVINLSGASLQRLPWTRATKRRILSSRLQATGTLADGMRAAAEPPSVFVSGSAVARWAPCCRSSRVRSTVPSPSSRRTARWGAASRQQRS